MTQLARLDAIAQAELCARGEVSAAELWAECLERIALLNPLLRAVVTQASASACGLFGFKPSRGRTVVANRSGSEFANMTSDHCLSRSVRDSALFLSLTEDRSLRAPVGFVRDPSDKRLRIGAWTTTMVGDAPEPGVLRAHEEVCALLSDLGHHVESILAPRYEMPALNEAYYLIAGAAVANVVETIDRTRGEPVQSAELEPFTWSLVDALAECPREPVPDSLAVFARAVSTYNELTRPFDVILTPTVGVESVPLGYLSPILPRQTLLQRAARVLGYTPVHNIAGCPAMSVPLHWSEAGLPIGAHFAAAPGQDALLLALAYELERAQPWQHRWPPYSIPMLRG